MFSPIFDGYNDSRSRSGQDDLCINLYPEMVNGAKGPIIGLLTNCPGLSAPLIALGAGPVRKLFTAKDGLMYAASGSALYSVGYSFSTGWVSTNLGALATGTGPASIIENPTQVLVVDGIGGWVWNRVLSTYTQVIPNAETSAAGPSVAVYQDGFGIVNSANSNEIYQSNYNDLSKFATPVGGGGSTANNAFVQGNPQDVISMFDINEEVFILKRKATEVWINNASPGFAFLPLSGVYMPVGCVAPASVARMEDGIVWLGSTDEGQGVVYRTIGYQAKSITPHSLAEQIQNYAVISDAIAYSYQSAGHFFYVLTFPTEGVTWAYDTSTQKWHQRAYTPVGNYERELANCHASYAGIHVVGDYRNGNLYKMDEDIYTDNGVPRIFLRSWRALPDEEPQGVPMSFDSLQILLETGVTVPAGTNPQIDLRFSDDGGYTWNGPYQVAIGRTGETSWRAIQNRLGSTTIGRGLDRVWEISGSNPVALKIVGAEWFGGKG